MRTALRCKLRTENITSCYFLFRQSPSVLWRYISKHLSTGFEPWLPKIHIGTGILLDSCTTDYTIYDIRQLTTFPPHKGQFEYPSEICRANARVGDTLQVHRSGGPNFEVRCGMLHRDAQKTKIDFCKNFRKFFLLFLLFRRFYNNLVNSIQLAPCIMTLKMSQSRKK